MSKILIIISLFFISCSGNVPQLDDASQNKHEQHDTTVTKGATTLNLNNGAKWKTDEATQRNVAAMVSIINDSSNAGKENKTQLVKHLQTTINTLTQQCKMKGPEHDALHVWLTLVLHDLKELKENDDDYQKSYTALKKDVESFFAFFE